MARRLNDLSGVKFGQLTVVSRAEDYVSSSGKHYTRWSCLCECGETRVKSTSDLKRGHVMSCGCSRGSDLTGKKFGKLTVVSRAENWVTPSGATHLKWNCLCDCGNKKEVFSSSLRSGETKSCGCYRKEKMMIHGNRKTRLYNIWAAMKQRCRNSRNPAYDYYGGRGIEMCEEWRESFPAFFEWAMQTGYDSNLTIDRRNNDEGYFPENCRWATPKQQANNRRPWGTAVSI